MTIQFPNNLDTFTNPTGTDEVAVVSHAGQHADANDAIEALEAKVGVDNSAVTTSHDYKLSNVADGDKALSNSGTQNIDGSLVVTGDVQSNSITINGVSAEDEIATFNSSDEIISTGKTITIDGTLSSDSDDKVPTEKAVRTYFANNSSTETDLLQGKLSDTAITVNPWTFNGTPTSTDDISESSGVITVLRGGLCSVNLTVFPTANQRSFHYEFEIEVNGVVPSDFQKVIMRDGYGSYFFNWNSGFNYVFQASPNDTIEIKATLISGSADTITGMLNVTLI